jgi:glucose/arabinose dehydrogenase
VRNSVGFDWHPKTKEMWFTDHGRDWAGDNGPQDELNRVAKPGGNYGFPYCHANGIADPDIKKADACKGVTRPAALMGSHAAVMGVKFYTGKMFPAEYQNTMFLVRKGSWNRTKPMGFDVVNVRVGEDGKTTYKPFATGFQQGGDSYNFWGRPAYVHFLGDGSMLLSDEQTGAIYRISYQRPKKAAAKKQS